jgi:benzil reductase ((S)-benzoin forming)
MKHIFITGTGKGIGKALAELLLKNNEYKVTGISRKNTIEHINYSHITTDLSNTGDTESIYFPDLKDIDEIVLINNAGVISEIHRTGKLTNSVIINDFNVNIVSPVILMNNFIRKYQHYTNKRTIINISSGAGKHAVDAWGVYCASKSALNIFSEAVSLEQSFQTPETQIKVFSVAPGVVDTEMQEKIRQSDENEFSNKEIFLNLKKNNELSSPLQAAELLLKIINNTEKINEVIIDVRHLTL